MQSLTSRIKKCNKKKSSVCRMEAHSIRLRFIRIQRSPRRTILSQVGQQVIMGHIEMRLTTYFKDEIS